MDRATILASIRFVDAVTVFQEDTPEELISQLLPDILVKGADYSEDQIAGAAAVRRAGGDVVLVELEAGFSSSGLVHRIQAGGAE
jgi:D-beta-D-heptose 7-phosphate kinase/D-beta-D-heptose 1-phosphate adenosyltransferase